MPYLFTCPEGHNFEAKTPFRAHCPDHPDKLAKRTPPDQLPPPAEPASTSPSEGEPKPSTPAPDAQASKQRVIRLNQKTKETRKRVPIRKSSRSSTSSSSTRTDTRSEGSRQSGPQGSARQRELRSTSSTRKSGKRVPLVTKKHSTENAGAGSQVSEKPRNRFDSYVDLGFGGFGRRA